ncbi:MAG: hypothetical protein MI749_10590 [Desulfovibrionales bacterium]|nr:hypothetical protein [Desulfovibrionales bacterium]
MDFYKAYLMPFLIGLLPVLLNCVFLLVRGRYARRKRLHFLAVRVSADLEKIVLWAIHAHEAWSDYLVHGGDAPESQFYEPVFETFSDVDWTVLDTCLLSRVMNLRNDFKTIEHLVKLEEDITRSETEAILMRLLMLQNAGRTAWTLSKDLRAITGTKSTYCDFYDSSLTRMLDDRQSLQNRHENGWLVRDSA